jgi:hypothetical protein
LARPNGRVTNLTVRPASTAADVSPSASPKGNDLITAVSVTGSYKSDSQVAVLESKPLQNEHSDSKSANDPTVAKASIAEGSFSHLSLIN